MPPLNKTVEAIRVKMKPFMPSTKLVPPTGIKSSRAYLINREGAIYMGDSEWMDGLPNGKGRLLYPDGSIYTGFFVRGVA